MRSPLRAGRRCRGKSASARTLWSAGKARRKNVSCTGCRSGLPRAREPIAALFQPARDVRTAPRGSVTPSPSRGTGPAPWSSSRFRKIAPQAQPPSRSFVSANRRKVLPRRARRWPTAHARWADRARDRRTNERGQFPGRSPGAVVGHGPSKRKGPTHSARRRCRKASAAASAPRWLSRESSTAARPWNSIDFNAASTPTRSRSPWPNIRCSCR